MKRLFIVCIFIFSSAIAQVGYVPVEHKIYSFLERMDVQGLIKNYNSFENPKTYKEIKSFLLEIDNKQEDLNKTDLEIFKDLIYEFGYEILGNLDNYSSIVNGKTEKYFEKEKYFYSYADSLKSSFFVNLIGESNLLFRKYENSSAISSTIIKFGGVLRGTIYDNFGFYLKATNGFYKGNKDLALSYDGLRYNYKANINPNYEGANSYFDETEGFIATEFKNIKLKTGRDRFLIGHGIQKSILSANPPPLDYLSFSFNYSIFNFTYMHGKLLSIPTITSDSLMGEIHTLPEKFIVYHRFGLDLSKHAKIGFGEVIIYGNRGFDLSYFNPFNFYKSIEHINQDRDNSLLFFDFTNNTFKGIKPFFTLLIDDIDFGKIGKFWYGNQIMWDLGVTITPFYDLFASNLTIQYTHIEPYFFTHRISYNNFTNLGYSLSSFNNPNSRNISILIDYYFDYKTKISLGYVNNKHGDNEYDIYGNLIKNVGGSIDSGHRPLDDESVNFLDGIIETNQIFSFSLSYEFLNNYNLIISTEYIIKEKDIIKETLLNSFLNIQLRI